MFKLTMNKMQPATPLSCLLFVCQSRLPPHLPNHTSSGGGGWAQETSAQRMRMGPGWQRPRGVTLQNNSEIHLS